MSFHETTDEDFQDVPDSQGDVDLQSVHRINSSRSLSAPSAEAFIELHDAHSKANGVTEASTTAIHGGEGSRGGEIEKDVAHDTHAVPNGESSTKEEDTTAATSSGQTDAAPDGEETGMWADLTYPDGRVIKRRKRSTDESEELDDEKRDADMANACKEEGNRNFATKSFTTAVACYAEAIRYLPRGEEYDSQRAIFYANRAACHLQMDNAEEALYDCDRALECNGRYAKAYARRMQALEKLEKLDEALADAQLWAEIEPGPAVRSNIDRLQKAIVERDEKLKEEMMGKLKDMGNWVLGKFGLSLDNFKAVKDPSTGSYSISFQQNNQ